MYSLKLAYVDVFERKVEYVERKDLFKEYLGGRGAGTRIYWEKWREGVRAFDPENPLIFMVGPMVATGSKGANRMVVMGKSPYTYPTDFFCYGNIGGFFPYFFRRSGFDGLVIEGASPKPVYLLLEKGRVEFFDASEFWGKNAFDTIRALKKRHGPGVEVLTIGQAGENLVYFATLVSSHQSSATSGFGAVMGSKKIKALVAKATEKIPVADKEELKRLNDYADFIGKRIRLAYPPKLVTTGKANLLKVIGRGSCSGCNFECIRGKYEYRKDLKGFRKCQAMEYYLPWLYEKDDEPIETLFWAPVLANDWGLCTFELEHLVDWLYLSYKEGTISERDIGLPLSEIGRMSFLQTFLTKLSLKKGIGELLSVGIEKAKDKLGEGPSKTFESVMKPISSHLFLPTRDLDEARGHLVNVLLYQMEPRRHRPLIHQGFTLVAWQFHQRNPESSPVSYEVYRKICNIFWGSKSAADDTTYEGKALAAFKIQNRIYALDSLGMCTFGWPITYSFNTPNHVGDPHLEAKLLSAVIGIPLEETKHLMEECGKSTVTLQRRILIKEGWSPPHCDWPPQWHFTHPLPPNPIGQQFLVPNGEGKPFSPEGRKLEKEWYRKMLEEYYSLRGWSEEGIPSL